MRWLNPGYYAPTEDEYNDGWDQGLIAVDASVLLGLYRYTADTRDQLLSLFQRFEDRLWLPYQAVCEFERNRLNVMRQQVSAYGTTLESFKKHTEAIRADFRGLTRHPLLDQDELGRITDDYAVLIERNIEETRERHPAAGANREDLLNDPTRAAVEALFAGRVGSEPDREEYEAAIAEARARTDAERPPGFLDKDKSEPDCFGDYLLWRESVKHAVTVQKPLVLITDDEKEDWWWRFEGLTLGPRPELVDEFFRASDGKRLLMYTTQRFIAEANRRQVEQPAVSAEAVNEVDRVAAERATDWEVDFAQCPLCGTYNFIRIGADPTHTATPTCQNCGNWFHAFHSATGGIDTRAPGTPRPRVRVACPSCGAEFATSVAAPGKVKRRGCFQCGARLVIDEYGEVTSTGRAHAFSVSAGEDHCPRCSNLLAFIYRNDEVERASCAICGLLVSRPISD